MADTTEPTFADGMALANWLHGEMQPWLKRTRRSHDKRVKLQAEMLTRIITPLVEAGNYPALMDLCQCWHEAQAAMDGAEE